MPQGHGPSAQCVGPIVLTILMTRTQIRRCIATASHRFSLYFGLSVFSVMQCCLQRQQEFQRQGWRNTDPGRSLQRVRALGCRCLVVPYTGTRYAFSLQICCTGATAHFAGGGGRREGQPCGTLATIPCRAFWGACGRSLLIEVAKIRRCWLYKRLADSSENKHWNKVCISACKSAAQVKLHTRGGGSNPVGP